MTAPITVLLIEANLDDARLVQEELRTVHSTTGIHLEWVDCLQKAQDYLKAKTSQAILVDLSLPDCEGPDALQRILDCAPQIPVIVLAGVADEEVATKAVQAGAQDYLIKGEVDGRLLVRAIRYAVQRK